MDSDSLSTTFAALADPTRRSILARLATGGATVNELETGKLKDLSHVCICAPAAETYRAQEYHLPIYHCLSLMLEEEFFG